MRPAVERARSLIEAPSVGHCSSGGLGVLPPPSNPGLPGLDIMARKSGRPDLRWGRAGERGSNRFGACGYPPSLSLPHKGGGNGAAPAFATPAMCASKFLSPASGRHLLLHAVVLGL